MKPLPPSACRRAVAVLASLALLALLAATPPARGRPAQAASGAQAAAAPVPVAPRRLVVMVTGDGRAVPDADLLLRAEGLPDRKLHTDERGEARWLPPADLQRVKLRVIATGWKTHHLEVALEPAGGDQAVRIALEPDPPAAASPVP